MPRHACNKYQSLPFEKAAAMALDPDTPRILKGEWLVNRLGQAAQETGDPSYLKAISSLAGADSTLSWAAFEALAAVGASSQSAGLKAQVMDSAVQIIEESGQKKDNPGFYNDDYRDRLSKMFENALQRHGVFELQPSATARTGLAEEAQSATTEAWTPQPALSPSR